MTAMEVLFMRAVSSAMALVHRLAYSGDVAAGQLAVFQSASEVPISGWIRAERTTRKNNQLTAARRVVLKMVARRVRIKLDMRPSRALPAAHFERNDIPIIGETVH